MYDFTVKDNIVTVGSSYFGRDMLNDYFRSHKLKGTYSLEEIDSLINAVAFVLDGEGGAGDHLIIDMMIA